MSRQDQFFNAIGTAGLKRSTGDIYWSHVDHFIDFIAKEFGTNRPSQVGLEAIKKFLTHLYSDHRLAPKSRNQALASLKFLYGIVIGKPIDEDDYKKMLARHSKHARRSLIGKPDLANLFRCSRGSYRLFVQLMYGGAMRLNDVVQLRVKDINFSDQQITINDCKHDHFRTVPFPIAIHDAAKRQLDSVRAIHANDKFDNPNGVKLPDARYRKSPNDARSLGWMWLFPSLSLSKCKETGFFGRHHIHPDNVRKQITAAMKRAGIPRRVTPHDIRRTAATRMHFEMNMPLARLQYILGHKSLEQTRDYILTDEIQINGTMSPLDEVLGIQ